MWLHRFTNYVLRHRWQTIALVFVSSFIPVLGIIGILIAALVTLTKSIIEGAILTIVATLPYIISILYTNSRPDAITLAVWAAVGVAVLSNILTWVFAVMLRRHTSWSAILQIAALLGVLVVSVIHLAYPQIADWWARELQLYYDQARNMATNLHTAVPVPTEMQADVINATKDYATGFMTAGIILNAILQLIAARWWQAAVYHRGQLRRELHNIHLSHLAGGLFILSIGLAYFRNSVILDIMPILYLLFGAAGLSLVHSLLRMVQSPTVWFWLVIFYVALIFSIPISVVCVAILGLLDVWLDVRKRIKKV